MVETRIAAQPGERLPRTAVQKPIPARNEDAELGTQRPLQELDTLRDCRLDCPSIRDDGGSTIFQAIAPIVTSIRPMPTNVAA